MPAFENLDAFQACHRLTLAVYRVVQAIRDRDPELAAQLWAPALCASARIARGSAYSSRPMFARCLVRTQAALAELAHQLSLAVAIKLLSEEEHRELESLRGRALFYTTKLLTSLISPPGRETGSPPSPE